MESTVLAESDARFVELIRMVWFATSDFPIADLDVSDRARVWVEVLGKDFFDKYSKYVAYVFKNCCRSRSWRGPVHVDEFYRMFCKIVWEKQVWSFRDSEWIPELTAMETIINSRFSMADRYRAAEEAGDDAATDQILAECRAIIYGWEE